eukprot:3231694-Alexandrium_andersonii.AAC.1
MDPGTCTVVNPLVKVRSGPEIQPEVAAAPERPTGPTTLSTVGIGDKLETIPIAGGAALRAVHPEYGSARGVSDFRRFRGG